MKVFAYCAQSFAPAMRKIAGVEPITCPPLSVGEFDVRLLEGQDLILFDLHGEPGGTQWYGDARLPALTAEQIRSADLRGAVVFGLNCYLADAISPMLDALLAAGAAYVVAGDGENFAARAQVFGCGELAKWFKYYLRTEAPAVALWRAKQSVRADLPDDKHELLADAMGFKMFYRRDEAGGAFV
jgi:hypothetical protein